MSEKIKAERIKAQVISGDFSGIVVRQKSGENLEIGELLIAESAGENSSSKILMQVTDLMYGSQLSQQNLELVSGMNLEEETDMEFISPALRNYKIATLKSLLNISSRVSSSKTLPDFFSAVRAVRKEDLKFITRPESPLFVGNLRSGSETIDIPIYLDGKEVLSHHILISATTGKGKSNLASVMLWSLIDKEWCGILVLDPHDEYYGRNKQGLKDHPSKNVVYYTPKNPSPGSKTLKINLRTIKPQHFNGVVNWTEPQKEALYAYYRKFGDRWIENIVLERQLDSNMNFNEATINVVKRRMISLLGLITDGKDIYSRGVFDLNSGETTVSDIVNELEKSKIVIVDTSNFEGSVELLIGSLIAVETFNRYRNYKTTGALDEKPVISILLEEAPRVLGKEVIEQGGNIFSTIAREGRKFKVGLTAITQLPSLIPRAILANMNTKIILGMEMGFERKALIESASQDLSSDDRNIASLDKGEAIITSNFARFATPVKIPLFADFIKQSNSEIKSKLEIPKTYKKEAMSFEGINQ